MKIPSETPKLNLIRRNVKSCIKVEKKQNSCRMAEIVIRVKNGLELTVGSLGMETVTLGIGVGLLRKLIPSWVSFLEV